MIMASFASIALYNVLELLLIIFATFKRKSGLYFWSFVVATVSIVPYTLGFLFKFFAVIDIREISLTMIAAGWCGMITGQSVVLYSRLHIVVQDQRILRAVLAMIIVDAVICHVPVLVLLYGANSSNSDPYIKPYSIFEKVQITIFFLQEVIISGLYIWSTWVALKPGGSILAKDLRKAMKHLIYINAAIVLLDLSLLATEYSGHYEIQVMYKAALYSAKLKMEFRILNQLVSLTKAKSPRDWSYEHSSAAHGTANHDLHTFSECDSKGPRMTVLAPDENGRIRPVSVQHTHATVGRTTADFERRYRLGVLDSDTESDLEGRGSMDITSESIDIGTKTISSSWSHTPLTR